MLKLKTVVVQHPPHNHVVTTTLNLKILHTLYVFSNKLELAEGTFSILVILQISKGNFENSEFQPFRSDLGSLSPVDQGLADLSGREHARCLDIIPIFAGEGVNAEIFKFCQTHNSNLKLT